MDNTALKTVGPKVITPSFPKEVVEGLLADALTQVKISLDSINDSLGDRTFTRLCALRLRHASTLRRKCITSSAM